jgi:hypothetical protein
MDPNTDPNAQMVDPAIGDDELEEFLKSLDEGFDYAPNINLGTLAPQGGTEDDDPNGEDDDENGDDDSEDDQTPAPSTGDDDTVTVNGQSYQRADVERLLEFDKYLKANPNVAKRMAEAANAESAQPNVSPTPPAPPSPVEFKAPEPPEGLDLDDPQTKFMWDQMVESRRESWETRQLLGQTTAQIQQSQQASDKRQAQEDMSQALTAFKQQFPHLNDDDIATIRSDATPLVESMMKSHPPVEALRRSMEAAAWANSDMRPKLDDPAKPNPTAQQRSKTRKRRLGALAGSSGNSAPKVDSRPTYTSDRDMVNEFAQALAESNQGR